MTWHTELLTGVVSLLGHFIALQYDDKMTVNGACKEFLVPNYPKEGAVVFPHLSWRGSCIDNHRLLVC